MSAIKELLTEYLILLERYLDSLHTVTQYRIERINQFEEGKYSVVFHFLNPKDKSILMAHSADLLDLMRSLMSKYNLRSVDIDDADITFYLSFDVKNDQIDILVRSLPTNYKEIEDVCSLFTDVNLICQSDSFWEKKIEHDFNKIIPYAPGKMKERYLNYGLIIRYRADIDQFDEINLPVKAVSISSGISHSLILDVNGDVWVFGSNKYGQLGLGDSVDRMTPEKINLPVKIIYVASGADHSMLIDENHEYWGFGKNTGGQLGLSDNVDRYLPEQNKRKQVYPRWTKISCGYEYSLLLDDNGSVFICGKYLSHSPSNLVETHQWSPNSIFGIQAKDISSAAYHSFLTTSERLIGLSNIRVFGINNHYQLGIGVSETQTPSRTFIRNVRLDFGVYYSQPLDVDVALTQVIGPEFARYIPIDEDIIQAEGGRNHSILLDKNNSVWTCGNNSHGQLGQNDKLDLPVPDKIYLPTKIISVFAGPFSSFLIDINNDLWMMGQSGDNNIHIPTKINVLDHKIDSIAANKNGFLALILY